MIETESPCINMTQQALIFHCRELVRQDKCELPQSVIGVILRAEKGLTLSVPQRKVLEDFLAKQ